jgi:hypothetical protein
MNFDFIPAEYNRLDRLNSWCNGLNLSTCIYKDIFWVNYNNIIRPLAAYSTPVKISTSDAKLLLEKLDGGVVRWTEKPGNIKVPPDKLWYIPLHSSSMTFEELPIQTRKSIDIGLNNCNIKRVEALDLYASGYAIYQKAIKSGHTDSFDEPLSENRFQEWLISDQNFDDIVHYFAIYHEHRLVGFGRCMIYNTYEAHLTHLVIDPDFQVYKLKHAFLWYVLEYYFYLSDFKTFAAQGSPLDPSSEKADFFLREFSFEKHLLLMNVIFRRDILYKMSFMKPFAGIVRHLDKRMHAYLHLEKQSRR